MELKYSLIRDELEDINENINYKGAFNIGTTYNQNDIVYYPIGEYLYFQYPNNTPLVGEVPSLDDWSSWIIYNLQYVSTSTQISEPIGFDDFKTILKRTEQHGVSAESSVGTLEFDGIAHTIISSYYNTDIDKVITLKAEIKCEDNDTVFETLYEGVIDLSTYDLNQTDYCSCKVKVGEIGIRTTFNNRLELNIDLDSLVSIDGDSMVKYSKLRKPIFLNAFPIEYKSTMLNNSASALFSNVQTPNNTYRYTLPFNTPMQKELIGYNELNEIFLVPTAGSHIFENTDDIGKLINFKGSARFRIKTSTNTTFQKCSMKLYDGTNYYGNYTFTTTYKANNTVSFAISFDETFTLGVGQKAYLILEIQSEAGAGTTITIGSSALSTITYKYIYLGNSTENLLYMAHEALSRVSESISGLTVKSDWFSRYDSDINARVSGVGGGALRAITNGKILRYSYFANNTNPHKMFISFKDLFLGFANIDNLGFGFSIEGGNTYIRVEKFNWFYNSNVIMTIDNPANKRRYMTDEIIGSELEVGYSKSKQDASLNGIKAIHTKRNYTTKVKSFSKKIQALSKFIADPYQIEIIRNESFSLDINTKDNPLDNDVFLFCLQILKRSNYYSNEVGNVTITPARNAYNFYNSFFFSNITAAKNFFLSGTGDIDAANTFFEDTDYYQNTDNASYAALSEKDDINRTDSIYKSELIEFEYPLTLAQYNDIKADPYGQIVVDGEACYIQEIVREVMTGMCEFKLIPKN